MDCQVRRAKRTPMGVESLEGRRVLTMLAGEVPDPAIDPAELMAMSGVSTTPDTAQDTPVVTDAVLYKLASEGNVSVNSPNDGRVYKGASGAGSPVATPAQGATPEVTATPVMAQDSPVVDDAVLYKLASETATPLAKGKSYLNVRGSAHGKPSTVVGNTDAGTTLKLQGKGQVQGVGSMKVAGTLHGTGFTASDQSIRGNLKLTNGKGSMTLHLAGPSVRGFTAPRTGTYAFNITGGTGAFKQEIGGGSVDLVLGPKSFALKFLGKPNSY